MVKLTAELLVRCSSGYTKRLRNETVLHYLRRLTHGFLERKSIDDVVSYTFCCCLAIFSKCQSKQDALSILFFCHPPDGTA
jgi:hypothetical protein